MFDFIINLVYYNSITTVIALTTFLGMELLSDPKNFVSNITSYANDTAYWCINKTLEYKVAYDEKIHPYVKRFLNSQSSTSIVLDNTHYVKHIINEEVYYAESFISDIEVSKPFLNFTVVYNNKEIDITEKLQQFLIVDNMICDTFIAAFLNHFGYLDDSNYSFDLTSYSYITSDCVMKTCDSIAFKVLPDNSVRFYNKDDNEVDNESDNEVDNESDNEVDNESDNEVDNESDNESDNEVDNESGSSSVSSDDNTSNVENNDTQNFDSGYANEITSDENDYADESAEYSTEDDSSSDYEPSNYENESENVDTTINESNSDTVDPQVAK